MSPAGKSHGPLVALSTASVFPERTPDAFEVAARLGYDGIEVMVSADAVSQDVDVIRRLVDYHGIPVLAVHAPCLLVTQRVWGREPWAKLVKSAAVAQTLGARVVVVHPPFRWQRDYAREFSAGLERMRDETGVVFAVENMYPLRAGGAEVAPYAPHWNPVQQDYPAVTLDLSHTSVSGSDAMAMAADLGSRLAHVHMADGTGVTNRDEHLVPGRGVQPCAPLLEKLAADAYTGVVVLEVNTRRAGSREARRADLAEALDFTRRHLAPSGAARDGRAGGPAGTGTGGTPAAGRRADGARSDRSRPDHARSDRARSDRSGSDGARSDGARQDGSRQDGSRADGTEPAHDGAVSRPRGRRAEARQSRSQAANRVRSLGRAAVSRPGGRAAAGRETPFRATGWPVPGGEQGTAQQGSSLGLRRWRRLDGQGPGEASCRS